MKLFIAAAILFSSSVTFAQHAHQHVEQTTAPAASPMATPYAGMQSRSIKALSTQQIEDLRGGKGMLLALPAELNGYPGPAHVLEIAGQLHLTDAQRTITSSQLGEMKIETKVLGEQLLDAELALDQLFSEKMATAKLVEEATANAARIQGALRAAHLRYHLRMAEVLNPAQILEYNKLRGYL